ncbi:MAG TPA: hypothetical protein VIL85_28920 [Thermomicrobiales bacterium]
MNKTLPVLTAALFGLAASLLLAVSLPALSPLPVVIAGSLAATVWGFTAALTVRFQWSSLAEVEVSHPPVVATGGVWGVGI